MARKERITRARARQIAAERAQRNGTAFNAELASINAEYVVADTPAEVSTYYGDPSPAPANYSEPPSYSGE